MAILKYPIPPKNYETIRDRISSILQDEFDNQATLQYSDLNIKVYTGRFIPFDKTELPVINVCFASAPFGNQDAVGADGSYIYNIDIYVSSASDVDRAGDEKASILLDKILGMAWSILENPAYDTLGFPRPSVTRVEVTRIDIADNASLQNQDAINAIWGRIQLTVVANEEVELAQAKLIHGSDTRVTINSTDKGYQYSANE